MAIQRETKNGTSSSTVDYENLKSLFFEALDVDTGSRQSFLDRKCPAGPIRSEIESLLASRRIADDFLEEAPVAGFAHRDDSAQLLGSRVGKYRIEKEIGRGGMGIVFLARREDFAQLAAVKIIKRGMDSEAIVRRFFRERQILAGLNHSNIAKLLDGGTTDDGRPYFVMEYVDGTAIDNYCAGLKEKDILTLYRKVCHAISFAHQKLVIHRDLKPSNILIDSHGEPKLLDFGIAKLLNETDSHETQAHERPLTPRYASPEQIRGEIVGTASDVCSLGTILSELLTGSRGDIKADNARVSGKSVKADLRNILNKAVSDDTNIRYASVESFSDDIRRYLEDLPVRARNISVIYRAQKFVRRNRAVSLFAALFVFSLLAGMTAVWLEARETRKERLLAEHRFDNLRKLSDSFVNEIHAAIQNLPGSLPARQLLLKRAIEQLDSLAEESGNNVELQDELASAYANLALLPDMPLAEKEKTLLKEISIYDRLLAADTRNSRYRDQIGLAYIELADLNKVRGSVARGADFARKAVSIFESVVDEQDNPEHLRHLRSGYINLSYMLQIEGRFNEVLASIGTARDVNKRINPNPGMPADDPLFYANSQIMSGSALMALGNLNEAQIEFRSASDVYRRAQEGEPSDTRHRYYEWALDRRFAIAEEARGNLPEAIRQANAALGIIESLLSTSPRDLGYNRNSAITHILLGRLLLSENQNKAAAQHFERALQLSRDGLQLDPEYFEFKMDMAASLGGYGFAISRLGRKREGIQELTESVNLFFELSNADYENAPLRRDYAETAGWLAAAVKPFDKARYEEYASKSYLLWNDLKKQGRLAAADQKRVREACIYSGENPENRCE